ncbi:3-hydroxyacyl-CoA dehydrogenase family protein [Moorella sp. Hama-1]|uniref:3-hydroxyacyl-CoA dehydrogenase family protein n=1 Tax=Moorella sp. Hama-1 TaxID=2138101 RepID=UPI000D65DBA3|nr:3-hydroxyacyl-CoA dehydrogenase NAD-binding domain-containing protein [Moorella sp. Hama-1]BCV21396.1 putative 3-hydroxybutyryl-CoA dehydrogenase [Moorella sp. Hama-1]
MPKEKIMVVGAGLMGAGIAQTCAEAGYETLLTDVNLELAERGLNKIEYFLKRKVEKGKLEESKLKEIIGRIRAVPSIEVGAEADVVIEAVTENANIKIETFVKLDKICKPETIFASNTSTISITLLGGATNRPEKVIGMHFFIPAPVMKLIEVIPGLRTSEDTFEKAMNLSKGLGKVPVKAPDTPAFLVNRLLVPMWNEAMYLVMEGNEPKDIDTAMKLGANLPMGPLELADFAGLDTVLSVMKEMYDKFGDPKYRPCPLLRKMVEGKLLGRKSGQGFYKYN